MSQLAERLKNMTPLQRAVFALQETQARLEALERSRTEPIAIVGMACRFPGGANDPVSYWRLLTDGVDAIGEIPPDRWDVDEFYDADPAAPGRMGTRSGGFLDRIDVFDNQFFGISDREAAKIDPQHRLLLELAWEALEDAGVPPASIRGTKVGVFIGISTSDYGLILSTDRSQTDAHAVSGTSLCFAANRVSFALGLHGPSVSLDTACSSSLVAVHLACQAIRNGDCQSALVGGVNLLLSPMGGINLTKAGFCAPDGRVRAFDAAAAGYVRSEGAGIVLLRPLSAAREHNDPVYAVIRGTAVNQNGTSNGLTAPSRAAQEQVLREAYARAGVSPGQVDFVETQGTGTRLGDVVEATALGNVLLEGRAPGGRCALGAVKTNIGHLEAASGVASLIKAALVLQHRQVPPNLHFQSPNPGIPFDVLPLRMPRGLDPWPDMPYPRFAGVSAFGFGGSNAHVVLEESTALASDTIAPAEHMSCVLPVSARTNNALRELTSRYREFLDAEHSRWPDVCHTAGARRDHHDCRLAVIASSHEQARRQLDTFFSGQTAPGVFVGRKPFGHAWKVAFIYDAQPDDWKVLAPKLIKSIAGFAAAVEEIDGICQRVQGWSIMGIQRDDERWRDPTWARSALVVLQLALTAWWRRAGISPNAVLGTGVGELAAATVAGILTVDQVLGYLVHDKVAAVRDVHQPQPASLPFISARDGRVHSGMDLDAAHWLACIRSSCDLTKSWESLATRNVDACLEIGPAKQSSANGLGAPGMWIPSWQSLDHGGVDVLPAVGMLYASGADLDWHCLSPQYARYVRVPTYPWQRHRLWALDDNHAASSAIQSRAAGTPGKTHDAGPIILAEVRKRPDMSVPYVAPHTKLEADLVEQWIGILGMEGIGIHDNFFELGGDSLQATILLNRLQEHLGETVPGHALFQVQNVKDLAEYLRAHCAGAVHKQYPDEPAAVDDGSTDLAAGRAAVRGGDAVSIPRLDRDGQADELLARLDELADDEVESLLGRAIADGEDPYE